MKHTPGPWYPSDLGNGKLGVQKHIKGIISRICVLHPEMLADEHGGNAIANARLIAAAPDLLEALQAITESIMYGAIEPKYKQQFAPLFERARAAIAEVEGKETP